MNQWIGFTWAGMLLFFGMPLYEAPERLAAAGCGSRDLMEFTWASLSVPWVSPIRTNATISGNIQQHRLRVTVSILSVCFLHWTRTCWFLDQIFAKPLCALTTALRLKRSINSPQQCPSNNWQISVGGKSLYTCCTAERFGMQYYKNAQMWRKLKAPGCCTGGEKKNQSAAEEEDSCPSECLWSWRCMMWDTFFL